jgi:acyl-CoA thioesterase-1
MRPRSTSIRTGCVRAALVAAAFLAGCGPNAAHLDSPGSSIVAFGDSITAGVGAGAGESYPEILSTLLASPIVKHGYPGETSADALGHLDRVLAERPWLVILEFGGNDILRRMPLESTEANLRQVLERLAAARVAVVLVDIRPPYIGGRYSDVFERLSDEFGAPRVDDALADILATPALKADEVHPNAAGHRQLAEAVAAVVRPLLEARR